ncbi:hypothetical protein [Nafulsella turpanensis]|uniref:hypothetical protein n=1 Tax=Nafulsella turpanensis TaxID=1265690 RepID=UPI00034CF832|nr:hypothetical protein [Nafulsella turpanensis]
MKTAIKIQRSFSFLFLILLAGVFVSCSDKYEQELGPRPEGDFTVTPIEGMPNTFLLSSNVEEAFRHKWFTDPAIGWREGGPTDTAYFELAGTYDVKMIAMAPNGHVVAEKNIVVEENAPGVACAGDNLALLTGCEESQTWVLDGEGSLWIGPVDESQTWWSLPAADLEARACVLNDEFTFFEDGTFIFENNGDFWVEEEAGAPHPADIGLEIGCNPADAWPEQYAAWNSGTHQFEVTEEELMVNGLGAFLGIYKVGGGVAAVAEPQESITYEIVELTAEKLVVEYTFGDGAGKWRFTFRPADLDPGEEPEEPEMPLEENDIAVDFDGTSTITEDQWLLDQVTAYEFPVANPDPDDVNPSANVFRYDRGTGMYENVQIHLDHKIDLTNRNKFSILVYFPSANDYTGDLAQTFAVKLQNRELGGDAWTTQEERKPEVEVLDEWVKLTFDFSDVTDRTDFDSIVLQPGGEGHTAPGTFYFDEFQLLPAE